MKSVNLQIEGARGAIFFYKPPGIYRDMEDKTFDIMMKDSIINAMFNEDWIRLINNDLHKSTSYINTR